jgi:hypothetical protein
LSRLGAKIALNLASASTSRTGSLLIVRRPLAYSATMWELLTRGAGCRTTGGMSTSTPCCVSGSAAMKMIRSTRRTSISGVTFISAERRGADGRMMRSEP